MRLEKALEKKIGLNIKMWPSKIYNDFKTFLILENFIVKKTRVNIETLAPRNLNRIDEF